MKKLFHFVLGVMCTLPLWTACFSAETGSSKCTLCVHPSNFTLSSIYLQTHGLIYYLILGFPENSWEFFISHKEMSRIIGQLRSFSLEDKE